MRYIQFDHYNRVHTTDFLLTLSTCHCLTGIVMECLVRLKLTSDFGELGWTPGVENDTRGTIIGDLFYANFVSSAKFFLLIASSTVNV